MEPNVIAAKRKLSSLHKYHYNRSRLNLHSCFYLGIQLDELPERSSICQALRETIAKYPELHQNVAIDPADDEPYIKNIDRVLKFDDVAEYVLCSYTEDTINQLFQTRKFPYHVEEPLWRLLVMEDEKILLLCLDHTLFDGLSAVAFWKTFVKHLIKHVPEANDEIWVPSQDPIVQEECHVYEKWPTTWSSRLRASLIGLIFKHFPSAITAVGKNQLRFKDYGFPNGLLASNEVQASSCFEVRNDNCQRTLQADPDLLKDLLSSCKRHDVSLTSFLAALFAISMKKCLKAGTYCGSSMKIDVPMSTRKACAKVLGISEDSMTIGNFVAPTELGYDLRSGEDLWEIAQGFHKSLKEQTTTDVISTINNVRLLDVADTSRFIREKIKAAVPSGTFEITNLGAQDFSEEVHQTDHFVVESAVFNEPQSISDIFTCAAITTPLGGLNCSISFPRTIKETIEPCIDYVSEYLKNRKFS